MVDFAKIPLELQLREANCHIQSHLSKGRKFAQILSPMFLQCFPIIMDNQISVDWNTIMGVFDWAPIFPITLIDVEILDYWHTHPSVWEVAHNLQHSQHVLAMVRYTLPSGHKGKPAVVYGASFVYIPAHQVQTSLSNTLTYLGHSKEDCVILVSTPSKLTYSPQPRRGKYFTLLPINGDLDADHGPLSSFAAATLPVASREGHGGDMVIWNATPAARSSQGRLDSPFVRS